MKNKKQKAARIVMTVLSAAQVGFIFFNSLQNADDSSKSSGFLLRLVNRLMCFLHIDIVVSEYFIRKAAHFTEYTVLGVLLCVTLFLWLQKRARAFFLALGAGAAVAACDEMIQLFSEGRSGQLSDVLLDFSGVVFGAVLVIAFVSIGIARKKKQKAL